MVWLKRARWLGIVYIMGWFLAGVAIQVWRVWPT